MLTKDLNIVKREVRMLMLMPMVVSTANSAPNLISSSWCQSRGDSSRPHVARDEETRTNTINNSPAGHDGNPKSTRSSHRSHRTCDRHDECPNLFSRHRPQHGCRIPWHWRVFNLSMPIDWKEEGQGLRRKEKREKRNDWAQLVDMRWCVGRPKGPAPS